MAGQRDYYQILGVSETATTGEIKKAFRRLAKQYHPDRNPTNPQAAERFKEINEAHDVLSDAEKRKKYDQLRRYGAFAGPGGGAGGRGGAVPGAAAVRRRTAATSTFRISAAWATSSHPSSAGVEERRGGKRSSKKPRPKSRFRSARRHWAGRCRSPLRCRRCARRAAAAAPRKARRSTSARSARAAARSRSGRAALPSIVRVRYAGGRAPFRRSAARRVRGAANCASRSASTSKFPPPSRRGPACASRIRGPKAAAT